MRRVVIFDLGGVLIDWDPRHLYRTLFAGEEAAMEHFLTHVCSPAWNRRQDAGRPFADAEAELIARHPEKRRLIEAWLRQFDRMIPGPIAGSVEIVRELKQHGVPVFALTNWSAETFAPQPARFSFLSWFDGIVVSGDERMLKPDPGIYRLLLNRYGVVAGEAVFIDDSAPNVAAANELGLHGIHFTEPAALRTALVELGLLPERARIIAE